MILKLGDQTVCPAVVKLNADLQTKSNIVPTTSSQTITPDVGYDGLESVQVNGDTNLIADNIKKDVSIFGVTGTYEGSGGGATVDTYVFHFSSFDYLPYSSNASESLSTYGLTTSDIVPGANRKVILSISGTGTGGQIHYSDSNDDDDWTITNINWSNMQNQELLGGSVSDGYGNSYFWTNARLAITYGSRMIYLDASIYQDQEDNYETLHFICLTGEFSPPISGYDRAMYNCSSDNGNFTLTMTIINY